jgi:hypothetical protein
VHYYGYRYYQPELGRWVNRDPIEGVSLVVFVANQPADKIDVLGQSIYEKKLNVPEKAEGMEWGVVKMTLPNLGVTDALLLSSCNCCEDTVGSGFRPTIRFRVAQAIYLNDKWKTDPNIGIVGNLPSTGGSVSTYVWRAKDVYGHEQLHVENIIKYTGEVMTPWFDAQETAAGSFATKEACNTKGTSIMNDGENHWKANVRDKEVTHSNPPPMASTPYDPINGNFPSAPVP